jgi:cytoskeletal protein CcmA (bactofilin family)
MADQPLDDKQLARDSLNSSLEGDQIDPTFAEQEAQLSKVKKPLPRKKISIVVGIIAVVIIGLILFGATTSKPPKKTTTTVVINTQSLDTGTLNKLESQNSASGSVQQQLTITPNTLFKNDVSVQGNLSANGTTTIQGAVALNSGLTVHGGLVVSSNTTVGGNLSVNGVITAGSLNVGSLTLASIQLSGSLTIGGHILTTGSAPTAAANLATSGGTVSVSGNDTSGTVTINVGNDALQAGELAVITFHSPYSATPNVQLTPITGPSAALQYFVTRSSSYFSINSALAPTKDGAYVYDYLVTQ